MGESEDQISWGESPQSINHRILRFDGYKNERLENIQKFEQLKQSISTPLEAFLLLFYDMIQIMVKYTNLYINQNDKINEMKSIFHGPIDEHIIKCYLAVVIILGYNHCRSVDDAFSQGIGHCRAAASIMTAPQYYFLAKNIHLVDNTKLPPNEPYYKATWMDGLMNKKFREYYFPSEFITIDEGIVPTKARLPAGLLQYENDKPDKWGLKVYKAIDCNGYLWGFFLFRGDGSIDIKDHTKTGSAIIQKLVNETGIAGHHHTLVMDNYFSSPKLFEILLDQKIYSIGTIRKKVGSTPMELINSELPNKGDIAIRYHSQKRLAYMAIRDSIKFYFLDSKYIVNIQEEYQSNKDVLKGNLPRLIPKCLHEYKKHMGEADMNERIIRDNAFYGHTKKWYFNYLFFIVESSIINSYIIFQQLKNYKPVFSIKYK